MESKKTRAIGGNIPEELYWEFKKTQAERKDSATGALEKAISLYIKNNTTEMEE